MKITTLLITGISLLAIESSAIAIPTPPEHITLVNKTSSNFSFMGICKKGGEIKGASDINPSSQVTYDISGADAAGEIGYLENAHHQVINFTYDASGYVQAKGGEAYYRYIGLCTASGSELIIENR